MSLGGHGLMAGRLFSCLNSLASILVSMFFCVSPVFGFCGDGGLEVGEECDDGNTARGDGCSAGCEIEAFLSRDDAICAAALFKRGTDVVDAQTRVDARCVRLAVKSIDRFPQVCVALDEEGKVEQAKQRVENEQLRRCPVRPSFGIGTTPEIGEAGSAVAVATAAELFGSNMNLTIAEQDLEPAEAECQRRVLDSVHTLLLKQLRALARCHRSGLRGVSLPPFLSASDIAMCSATVDTDVKVAKSQSRVARIFAKRCTMVNSAQAFPGACGESLDFSACVRDRLDCRACEFLRATIGASFDCDRFDDGAENTSCS